MRNRNSDLLIPRSDALPLSHRDSTVSEIYFEVHDSLLLQLIFFTVISVVAFDGKIFVELIQILDERKKNNKENKCENNRL